MSLATICLQNEICLSVQSEVNDSVMLSHMIGKGSGYQRQGEDTIITWTDNHLGTDVALSFQEASGCNYVWGKIQNTTQTRNFGTGYQKEPETLADEEDNDDHDLSHVTKNNNIIDDFEKGTADIDHSLASFGDPRSRQFHLPEPNLGALHEISKILSEINIFQRDSIAAQLLSAGYLSALMSSLQTARDLGEEKMLRASYNIAKGILLLNDTTLIELIFTDEYFWDLLQALEADPDVPEESRFSHKKFLLQDAAPKEIIPINSESLRSKINLAQRMGYIKDVVLPRVLDDAAFATLSSLQLFNNVDVLLALQKDNNFFQSLFERFWNSRPCTEEFQDLVAYLQEILSLSRHLQACQRNMLVQSLAHFGLFKALAHILSHGEDASRLKGIDILLSVVVCDCCLLRSFLLNETEGKTLFKELVTSLYKQSLAGLQDQAAEVLRILLDPDTLEEAVEKDVLLDLFYEAHFPTLLQIVVDAAPTNEHRSKSQQKTSGATLVLIIELFCFCICQHKYRIKYYVLRNNVVEKVLRLLKRKEIIVAAAALRFIRVVIGSQDDFYIRDIVKNSLMDPVLITLMKYHNRYNLLSSSILELLNFICANNLTKLVTSTVESPVWKIVSVELNDVEVVQKLISKYSVNETKTSISKRNDMIDASDRDILDDASKISIRHAAAIEARKQRGEKEEDIDEDKYFNEGDDSDSEFSAEYEETGIPVFLNRNASSDQVVLEDSPQQNGLPPLVDYGDDDDDTLPLHLFSSKDDPKDKEVKLKRSLNRSLTIAPESKKQKETF